MDRNVALLHKTIAVAQQIHKKWYKSPFLARELDMKEDRLLTTHPTMFTYALHKAFKPLVEELNNRVHVEYIIPDWYPLKLIKDKWDDEVGGIRIMGAESNGYLIKITLDSDGYFNMKVGYGPPIEHVTLEQKVYAADPKSFYKIKDFIVEYLAAWVDEVSLVDLPIGT